MTRKKILELVAQIEDKEKELKQLQQELKKFEILTGQAKVATILHELTCRLDHDSECNWYKETFGTDASSATRRKYLKKALEMLSLVNDADKLIKILVVAYG